MDLSWSLGDPVTGWDILRVGLLPGIRWWTRGTSGGSKPPVVKPVESSVESGSGVTAAVLKRK